MERFTAYACHAIADGNACQRFAAIERLTAYPCYTIGNYYACQRPAVTERITSYACYGIIVVDIVVDDRRNDEICVCACTYAGYSACDAVGIDFISKPFGCLFEFCDSFFFKFYMASCTFGMAFAFFAFSRLFVDYPVAFIMAGFGDNSLFYDDRAADRAMLAVGEAVFGTCCIVAFVCYGVMFGKIQHFSFGAAAGAGTLHIALFGAGGLFDGYPLAVCMGMFAGTASVAAGR